MSTFFRNVDPRTDIDIPIGNGRGPVAGLRARAVLVDMEDGVLNETLQGPIGELFDQRHFIRDVSDSGSGNNWAHGYSVYGPQHQEGMLDVFQHTAEKCDSLQSFFLMHSMGGGTGSGLGTYILSMLEDNFKSCYRIVTAVFPSDDDDVITSPYNAVLGLKQLTDHADCVLPVDNQALLSICGKIANPSHSAGDSRLSGFDSANGLVASLLTDLTASMRFSGGLNVDLNEITTNLVPYPRLHYLMSSLSPLRITRPASPTAKKSSSSTRTSTGRRRSSSSSSSTQELATDPRNMRQLFSDAFLSSHQLMTVDPRAYRAIYHHDEKKKTKKTVILSLYLRYLACGLLLRGDVVVSDVNMQIRRLQTELNMIHWNREGFKIGLCSTAPIGWKRSLLCLSNNCGMGSTFAVMKDRFTRLYNRNAMMHHYTQFIDAEVFDEALDSLVALIDDYRHLNSTEPRPVRRRPQPAF
ncbi:unnamed protein product [Chrysoparadoxa australica]